MRGSQGPEGVPDLLMPRLALQSSMANSAPSDSPGPHPLLSPSTLVQEVASPVCSEDKNPTDVSQDLTLLAALNELSFLQSTSPARIFPTREAAHP